MEPVVDLPFGILILVIFAAVVIALGIYAHLAERKRQEALAATAAGLGLTFRPDRDRGLAAAFQWLGALANGTNRYAYNILRGQWRGHPAIVFDYHYQVTRNTGKSSSTTHYHLSVFALTLPVSFPELRIVPEEFGSKVAQAFGWEDIDFESAEFSGAFTVRSKDRRFAYDVCHPRMMEFLLNHRDLRIEIEGDTLATWSSGRLRPETLEPALDRIAGLRGLLPNYLFAEQQTHA